MPKKFTLIFDYDDFLQQKKRPPIFTNQRAHDAILFHNLTLPLPYAACRWRAPRRCRPRAQRRGATFRCKAASHLCRRPQPPHRQQPCIRRPQRFLHSDSGNNPAPDVRNASCTATPAITLHPTSATRTRFQLTPDRVRGCDSCPACTATRCRWSTWHH